MNQEQRAFLCSLRRQHHLLWLLLGMGLALFLCSKLVQEGASSVGLLVGLLVAYGCAGRCTANLVARLVWRSPGTRPRAAIFASSVKIGALFSALSVVFHLALMVVLGGTGSLDLRLDTNGAVPLRAALLPFLVCLGAACTVCGAAPAEELEPSSLSRPVPPANVRASSPPRAAHASKQEKGQQPSL